MSWTDTAAEWIAAMVKEYPGMARAELEKLCRKEYPFAMRRGWAYKAWLKAMRAYFRPQSVRPCRRGRIEPSAAELEKLGQKRLVP